MSNTLTPEQVAALAEPFAPADVDFRVLDGNQVAAYVDVRTVDARLNAVFGPDGWDFDWFPLVSQPGVSPGNNKPAPDHDVIWLVKGTLIVNGHTHSDIGEGDKNETSKTAVSDSRKRSAVQLGVGAYLYNLGRLTAQVDGFKIPPHELARLRGDLPVPAGYVRPAPQAQPVQERASAPQSVTPGERERVAAVADRAPVTPSTGSTATENQIKAIKAIARAKRNWAEPQVVEEARRLFGKGLLELNRAEASQFIDKLQAEQAA